MENESMEPAEDFTEKTEEDIPEVFSDELRKENWLPKSGTLLLASNVMELYS